MSFEELYRKDPVAALQLVREYLRKMEEAAKKSKTIPVQPYLKLNDLADLRMIEKELLERKLSGYTPGRMLYAMSAPLLFSPSNYLGFLVDLGVNDKSLGDAAYRWLSGTNSGVVPEYWGARHPGWQFAANLATDIVTTAFMPTSIGTKTTSMKFSYPSAAFRSATDDIVRGPYAYYTVAPDGSVVAARSMAIPTTIADVMPRTINLPLPQVEVLGSAKPAPAFAAIEAADTSVGNVAGDTAAGEGNVAGGASNAVDNPANNQQGNLQQGNLQGNNQQGNQQQGNLQPQNNLQPQGNNVPENQPPKKAKRTPTEYLKLSKSKKTGQEGVNEIIDSYKNGNINIDEARNLLKAKKLDPTIYKYGMENLDLTTELMGKEAAKAVVKKQSQLGGLTNFVNNTLYKSGSFNFKNSPFSSTLGRLFPFATLTGGIYGYNQLTEDKPATSNQNTETTTEKTDTTSVNTNKLPLDSTSIRYIAPNEQPFILE